MAIWHNNEAKSESRVRDSRVHTKKAKENK